MLLLWWRWIHKLKLNYVSQMSALRLWRNDWHTNLDWPETTRVSKWQPFIIILTLWHLRVWGSILCWCKVTVEVPCVSPVKFAYFSKKKREDFSIGLCELVVVYWKVISNEDTSQHWELSNTVFIVWLHRYCYRFILLFLFFFNLS